MEDLFSVCGMGNYRLQMILFLVPTVTLLCIVPIVLFSKSDSAALFLNIPIPIL
jgi:hypothetical protein